jgi:hypothetical protein
MLFLLNIVSGSVLAVNFYRPQIRAQQPGFLIYISGSTLFILLGLMVNMTVAAYIISIMRSYFKEEGERRSTKYFLEDATALLGVDEFNRCLLL